MKLYETLGLTSDATLNDIKKAYRKLSLKYHPDKSTETDCEQKFITISQAYNILKDQDKRARYDKLGDDYNESDEEEDPYSMFKTMYEESDIVPNLDIFVEISTKDLYFGCTVEQDFTRYNICNKCRGNGTFDGKPHKCSRCNGVGSILEGTIDDELIPVKCDTCNGSGIEHGTKLCEKCNGTVGNEEDISIDIEIPAGAYNGYIIVKNDVGHEIPKSERKQDGPRRSGVNFIVDEIPHKHFHRGVIFPSLKRASKADLLYDVNLTLIEALCGFKRTIKYLSGNKLKIEYSGQVWHNDYLVYKKKGMPIPNSELYGDLFIRVNIDKPDLNISTRKKLRNILPFPDYDIKSLSTSKHLQHFDDFEKEILGK